MLSLPSLSLLALGAAGAASAAAVPPSSKRWNTSPCRYAPTHSQEEILADPSSFLWDFFYWEGMFHQNNVGMNMANGMTYDGTLLDPVTGIHNVSELHQFSAASKESLQIMVFAHALNGNQYAQRWIAPDTPWDAGNIVADLMATKLQTYLTFNETYPGFGGMLPWYANYANGSALTPTWDWVNRMPALDNGELLWAVYAAVEVMSSSSNSTWQETAAGWQKWIDYTQETAPKIFYLGDGKVCAVTGLNQSLAVDDPNQNYTCEGSTTPTGPGLLDDPYEGELFAWWLYLFGNLSDTDKEAIWEYKRAKLVSVEYTGSNVNTSWSDGSSYNYTGPVVSKTIGPITVQEGFWFSAHEQWKLLEMPYRDVDIVDRVFRNAERVRTCNSVLMGQNGGLYASVNNVTNTTQGPSYGQIIGYISDAGIPDVSSQFLQEQDVITPYGAFPTILFDLKVGLAWYKNMLDGQAMQNLYGSTEATRRDGTNISAFVSWDSKVSTVAAVLGGVGDFTRSKLQKEGHYDAFWNRLNDEYSRVFGNGLKGEDVEFCLPDFQIPKAGVQDFTSCS